MHRADLLAFDRQTLRRFDVDGRMHVADCRISKANVCPYYGREIPNAEALGLDLNRVYMLYRDPAELAAAAKTFANLQLLMVHVPVHAGAPRTDVTVGVVGSDVRFEAPYLVASLAVWTAEAIALIESETQAQLSSAYRYRADMTPGVTPEGVAFDGVMRDLIGNHVALVEEGRAGPDVMVNDSAIKPTGIRVMKFVKLIASLVAAGVIAKDAKPEALDAELEKIGAKDAEVEAAEDSDETDEEKRKRLAAEDESAPVEPGPKKGEVGAALDAALQAGSVVTKADAQAMADAASLDAVTRINALHVARDSVKPICGVVALDSAEAVYRFALDHIKVDHKPVKDVSALALLVDAHKSRLATDSARPVPVARIAIDAAGAISEAIPGLSRVNHA